MTWQRARSPEKITERKIEILDAAKALFQKKAYSEISLNEIARQAGFSKSNVYRYFATREEIFLSIFSELFELWSQDMLSFYKKSKPNTKIETFAKGFVKTSLRHRQFLDLLPLLSTSLEENSSRTQLLSFKRLSVEVIGLHAESLARIFPGMNLETSLLFLKMTQSFFASFWTSSKPNKELAKIYKESDFKAIAPNFETESVSAIAATLYGLTRKL